MALRSDLRTPPLCPLVDIILNGDRPERFPGGARGRLVCRQVVHGEHGEVPRTWFRPWNSEKLRGVTEMGWGGQAMDQGGVDVRLRVPAGVRRRMKADGVNGGADRGASVLQRRGAVYVDEAIWEWQGLRWAHLLADDTDDLHRFAAALGIHRTSYQGPPRTSVPHYDLTSYERRRAIACGAIACGRDEIVAVVRRTRSSCAARGAQPGS